METVLQDCSVTGFMTVFWVAEPNWMTFFRLGVPCALLQVGILDIRICNEARRLTEWLHAYVLSIYNNLCGPCKGFKALRIPN